MGNWYEVKCRECGDVIHCHVDWDREPDLCKACVAERKAKWYTVSCDECGALIRCHFDWDREPSTCKKCIAERKAKWHEKSCGDCGTTIRYHEDWNRIPDICKSCIDSRKAKWHEKSCSCGVTIRYHEDWNRIPDLCRDCIRKAVAARAKWHAASCAHCGATYRYHEDWVNKPSYCRDCNEWLVKECAAQDCDDTIRYRVYWDDIPEYCGACKGGERRCYSEQDDPDGTLHVYEGWGYINRQGIAVFVDDGPHGKHSHAVYNPDGTLRGHRAEGCDQDWVNEAIDVTIASVERGKEAVKSDGDRVIERVRQFSRYKTLYKDRKCQADANMQAKVHHSDDYVEINKSTGKIKEGSVGEYCSRTRDGRK
ncbi:MAG: hypothetical protein V1738_03650 [Patescibacteria group bacterium]